MIEKKDIKQIEIGDFQKADIRVGKIMMVEALEDGKYSTHRLVIDFGAEVGSKVSCARLVNYSDEQLLGMLVLGVVNLSPRQIGKTISQVLTLGVPGEDGE